MRIMKEKLENKLIVSVIGRLDTNTSVELETSVKEDMDGVTDLYFDFQELDYISSAGLRVVLMYHKLMNSLSGKLTICNPKEAVMDVFDMTGFSTFLNIKE